MKIGFDLRPLQTAHKNAGIGTYTLNLAKHLMAINSADEFLFYMLSGIPIDGLEIDRQLSVFRFKRTAHPAFWEQLLLPFDIMRGRIDVFHVTGGLTQVWEIGVPYFQPCKTVVTIYDLHPLLLDSFSFIAEAKLYKLQLKAAQKATRIITISESAKKDIIALLGIPEERIHIVYPGRDTDFRQVEELQLLEDVKAKYGIKRQFVLYVGNYNVHKNVEALIRAFALLKGNFELVIVGKKSTYPESTLASIRELQLERRVIFTDRVSKTDLVLLYNAAELFVFPSIYEGFGIPPLEAMSCGCPVITSNRASLPEVVGDAGMLIAPEDIGGIADVMQEILVNTGARLEMSKKGLKQADRFSWEEAARVTLAVYHKAHFG